ncbi:MAG: cobalt ECF transporter T component CbiQ [Syntrophobacteraceae bacterium]
MVDFQMPEWLLQSQGPLPPPGSGKKSRRDFAQKSIGAFSGFLMDDFYAERIASQKGLMQGLHPGVKVATSLLLIFVASCMHSWVSLLLINLYMMLLAYVSAVPLAKFLKRVWVFIPIFTVIVVLPTLFNVVRPGDPLVVLFRYGGHHQLTITRQGVQAAVLFVLRVAACVSAAVLLTLTTRWAYLLRGFRMIGAPAIFVRILEMTYRYIYVFLHSAGDMFESRLSRTVGRSTTRERQRFVGNTMGALWMIALELSDEVHAAMLSRGYTGAPRTLTTARIRGLDWVWTILIVLLSIILLGGDRFVW